MNALKAEEDEPARPFRRLGADDAWLIEPIRNFFHTRLMIWRGRTKGGHVFGHSAASVLGRIKDEGEGASHGTFTQHFAEVFSEESLLVRRAMEGVDYDALCVAHLHYMVSESVSVKSRVAGYSPAGYWQHLSVFHSYVKGRLRLLDPAMECLDKNPRSRIAKSV